MRFVVPVLLFFFAFSSGSVHSRQPPGQGQEDFFFPVRVLEDFESDTLWYLQIHQPLPEDTMAVATTSRLGNTQAPGDRYLSITIQSSDAGGFRVIPRESLRIDHTPVAFSFLVNGNESKFDLFVDLTDRAGRFHRIYTGSTLGNRTWQNIRFSLPPGFKRPVFPGDTPVVFRGFFVKLPSKKETHRLWIDHLQVEVRAGIKIPQEPLYGVFRIPLR